MRRRLAIAALALSTGTSSAVCAPDDAALAEGRALFATGAVPACATCHTLRDAGASGAVGPILDELQPDAARVATAVRNGIGQMPSYATLLTDAQVRTLAAYVAKVSAR